MSERVLGPDHPETAHGLNDLARLLQDQGDLAAARPLFERALAIRERVLGPDHPDTGAIRPVWSESHLILDQALRLWAAERPFRNSPGSADSLTSPSNSA